MPSGFFKLEREIKGGLTGILVILGELVEFKTMAQGLDLQGNVTFLILSRLAVPAAMMVLQIFLQGILTS